MDYVVQTFLSPLMQSYEDNHEVLNIISLVIKITILVVYSAGAVTVMYKVRGGKTNMQAIITILVFFLCLLLNVVIFGFKNHILGDYSNYPLACQISSIVIDGFIVSILYYYTFEIKVVLLKVETQTVDIYLSKLRKAKYVLFAGLITLALSNSLEIYERIELSDDIKATTLSEKVLIVSNRILSMVTDLPLIYFQWSYLYIFFKLRRERYD